MRILMYSHRKYACGASVAAARLAMALKAKGHEIAFAHSVPQARKSPLDQQRMALHSLGSFKGWRRKLQPVIHRAGDQARVDITGAILARRLLTTIENFKPDVISLHNNYFPADFLRRLSAKYPIAWTMHDCFAVDQFHYKIKTYNGEEMVFREPPDWTIDKRGPDRLKGMPGAFHLISPSQWLARHARETLKGDIPVHVVPNVLPERDFKPRGKLTARAKLGLDPDAFYVLFLAGKGAWQRKNFEILKAALDATPDLDIRVLLRGGVPDEIKLNDRRIIPVSETWSMLELSELFSASDVFCISSVLDNLPNTVLESLACGTPVVGANVGGIPEMVIEGRTGWLFDPYDAASLVAALRQAEARKGTLGTMARDCRDLVWQTYRRDAAAKAHLALFDEIIAEHKRKVPNAATVKVPGAYSTYSKVVAQPIDLVTTKSYKAYRAALTKMRDSHIAPYKTWKPSLAEQTFLTTCYKLGAAGRPIRDNERRILAYKDIYKGRRGFMIGNGPSLNKLDLTLLRDEITIGVNSIFLARERMGFLPTHYVVEDIFVAEDRADAINALRGTQKWYGNYLRYCLKPDPDTLWLNVRMRYDEYPNFPDFSQDALRQCWTGGSVTYICMQLMYYFGIKDLYLIGFDHHYEIPKTAIIKGTEIVSTEDDPNHFDPTYFGKGFRWHDPKVDRMEKGYKKAANAFRKRGGSMKNATAGGKLDCIPRVDYFSLFPKYAERRIDQSAQAV